MSERRLQIEKAYLAELDWALASMDAPAPKKGGRRKSDMDVADVEIGLDKEYVRCLTLPYGVVRSSYARMTLRASGRCCLTMVWSELDRWMHVTDALFQSRL